MDERPNNIQDIYLNPDLKSYYLSDFALVKVSKAYPLDPGVEPFLTDINKNPFIQTLFSKKPDLSNGENESYIEFCFFKDCESYIRQSILPNLINQLTNDKGKLTFINISPSQNPFVKNDVRRGIGCWDNPNYFMINTIKLQFESDYIDCHENFWSLASQTLMQTCI